MKTCRPGQMINVPYPYQQAWPLLYNLLLLSFHDWHTWVRLSNLYTNFIYFSERRKDESTSSCSPAVLELTIVFLLRGIYSYFLNSRGILSTWNDKTKTLILSWTYMFLNSSNLRSVPVYKKTNIFLSMSFKKSCTFICNYKKKVHTCRKRNVVTTLDLC